MIFTERSLRIIKNAEIVAEETTKVVLPVHLLMGALLERTGVCGELVLHFPNLYEILYGQVNNLKLDLPEQVLNYEPFTTGISNTTKQVIQNAELRMERYKQGYINEGLLIHSLLKLNDPLTIEFTKGVDVSCILEIVSSPRDMVISLEDYLFPEIDKKGLTFRKAESNDFVSLKYFIEKEFGSGWLTAVENGFTKAEIPIYIAVDCGEIIGFAGFDIVRNKKGLFGPMGMSFTKRIQGIGYTLLHCCLKEMKEIGYEYAVIGQAGPIEFYEKSCNAVVIPKRFDCHQKE